MTTTADPKTDPVTEPQRVLLLSRAGYATREIARLMNLSQSTVSRRLTEAVRAETSVRQRQLWFALMYVLLTASALTIAAADAYRTWGR